MRAVMLGPPGAGKGTQAALLSKHFHVPTISTGNMLRQAVAAGTEVGLEAKAVMEQGQLVSDALMIRLLLARMADPDCAHGYILDGFPRTMTQAEALKVATDLNVVIECQLSDDVIVERLSGRRVHKPSGRTYHIVFDPPRREGYDDVTGDPLIQRADDRPETIRERLAVYRTQTQPLINYYRQQEGEGLVYVAVSALGDVATVHHALLQSLEAAMR